jgi:hypothetical protein
VSAEVDPDSHGSHSGIEDGHKGPEPVRAAFEPSEFCCHFPSHLPGWDKGRGEFREAQIGKVATFNWQLCRAQRFAK